jgi:hypothetical protein
VRLIAALVKHSPPFLQNIVSFLKENPHREIAVKAIADIPQKVFTDS